MIAEFLGWKKDFPSEDIYKTPYAINISDKEPCNCTVDDYDSRLTPDEMLFHSNWNWLMEVVSKINTMEDFRFSVRINHLYTFIRDHKTHTEIIDEGGNNTIDECYNAVAEFIKFYNQ